MKILYLVHQFYPDSYTGTEKFLLELAKASQRLGHRVRVVSYSSRPHSFFDQVDGDLLLKEYSYEGIPVLFVRSQKETENRQQHLGEGSLLKTARRILSNEAPDIVHGAHTLGVLDFIYAAREAKIPYLLTLTDFFLLCPKLILMTSSQSLCAGPEQGSACRELCPEIVSPIIRKRLAQAGDILRNANCIIAPSKFLANMFLKEYGDLKIVEIGYGISYPKIRKNMRRYQQGDKLTFFYGGSFIRHKGVHILIEAFRRVKGNAELKIYGSGQYEYSLRQAASQDPRIKLCGVFSSGQIGDVLSQIDVAVVPSIWYENTPIILLESLASNIPVIATDLGGMTEAVNNGINGRTFRIGDVEELEEIIDSLINKPETLNTFKDNIKNQFIPSVEQVALAYEKEYLKACTIASQYQS